MAHSTPIAPLSQPQQRTAEHLVHGRSIRQTATMLNLSPRTVENHTGALRIKMGCRSRAPLHVLVHVLLNAGLTTPEPPDRPAPSLDAQQLQLLQAIAEHDRVDDVALAAGIDPSDVADGVQHLVDAAGADDVTHLVILAHGWGLLGQHQSAPLAEGP